VRQPRVRGRCAARSRFSCDARLAPKPVDLSPRLRSGWPLVATPLGTEMGIDTGAPMGKAMAHIAVVFAELEQDLIRMRTYPRGAAGQGRERRHAKQVKIDAAQAVRCSPSLERPRVKASTREGGAAMAEAPVETNPETIVLIHGFWVTPRSWEEVLRGEGLYGPRPCVPGVRGRGRGAPR
jgi:hypothetical protein